MKKVIIIILLLLIGASFSIGSYFLYQKYFKEQEKEDVEEKEVLKEVPKLKIIDVNSKSRPIAVMINNLSTARPYQSGLQDAYLIYEIIAEGGITRFIAFFKDQDTERIASVRSTRPYFLDYVLENDAIFVHWGWSTQAYQDIKSLKIDNIDGISYENKYFKRDNTLNVAVEHRGYTSMSLINKAINDLNYRQETNQDLLFNYSVDEIDLSLKEEAIKAENIDIKFSSSTTTNYQYDNDTKTYLRSVNNKANIDYITKKQYYFKNIITYQVKNTSISNDDKGRQSLSNIGSGNGYYMTNGYAIPIKWEKKTRSSQTKYYDLNGEELIINDGNTFVEIQPLNQSLSIK